MIDIYTDENIKLFLNSAEVLNILKNYKVVAIMLGGSRCLEIQNNTSDYDINILVENPQYFYKREEKLIINNYKFHWYFHNYLDLNWAYTQDHSFNSRFIDIGLMQVKYWKPLLVIDQANFSIFSQKFIYSDFSKDAANTYIYKHKLALKSLYLWYSYRTIIGKHIVYYLLAFYNITNKKIDCKKMLIVKNKVYKHEQLEDFVLKILYFLNYNILQNI